jgi:hypothetical protein
MGRIKYLVICSLSLLGGCATVSVYPFANGVYQLKTASSEQTLFVKAKNLCSDYKASEVAEPQVGLREIWVICPGEPGGKVVWNAIEAAAANIRAQRLLREREPNK